MSNSVHYSKLFLLYLCTITFVLSTISDKIYFTELSPYSEQSFVLNGKKKFPFNNQSTEAYFSFQNKYDTSDVIIIFSKGFSYSTMVYVYSDYSKIAIDETEQYINHDESFKIGQKQFILSKDKVQYSKTILYIIIKETLEYFYNDSISIFNEKDAMPIAPNSVVSLNRFYSINKRLFLIKALPQEIINISIQKVNQDTTDSSMEIYKDKELIAHTTETSFKYSIQTNEFEGVYQIEITSKAIQDNFLLLYNKNKRKFQEIKENSQIETKMIQTGEYFFYSSLENKNYQEEGALTAFFDYHIIENKRLQKFNVKIVNRIDDSDDTLEDTDLIEKETQFNYYPIDKTNTCFRIPFYNSESLKETMTTYILIYINIELDTPEGLKFSLGLSSTMNKITFSNNDIVLVNQALQFNTPSFVTIDVEKHYSYIIYSSLSVQSIYYNSLFLSNYSAINTISYRKQLYAFVKGSNDRVKELVIELYGDSQDITITIERTTMNVTYYNDNNNNKIESFASEIFSSQETYYHIESLNDWSHHLLFIELIFGKCDIYFKNDFLHLNEKEGLLPKREEILGKSIISMTEYNSIIGLKCSSSGYINLYLIQKNEPLKINKESTQIFSLETDIKYSLSIEGKYDNNFGIELSLITLEGNIDIKIDQVSSYKLNDSNSKLNILVSKETGKIELYSNKDSFISVRLGADKEFFNTIDSPGEYNNDKEQIVFKLNNLTDYHSISIEIANVNKEGLQFEVMKAKYPSYIPLHSLVNNRIIIPDLNGNCLIKITNPYDKYQSSITSNEGLYYIAISFVINNSKPDLNHKIKYSYHNKQNYASIAENSFSQLFPKIPLLIKQQSDIDKTFVLITNHDGLKNVSIQLEYYEKVIEMIPLPKGLSKHILPNHNIDFQLTLISPESLSSEDRIQFSYVYSSNDDLNQYDIYDDFTVKDMSYDSENNILSWSMSKEIIGNYKIYMIPQEQNITSLDYYNYLSTQHYHKEIQSFKSESNKATSLPKFLTPSNYYINIIVRINSPLPIEIVSKSILINIPDESSQLIWLWTILSLIGFIVLLIIVFFICRRCRLKANNSLHSYKPVNIIGL